MVERRFQALHGCQAETVTETAGGWMAVGCGVRAHFMCFDKDHESNDLLMDLLFDDALVSDDVCIQEQVDRGREHAAPRDPTVVSKGADGTVRLRAHVTLRGEPRGDLLLVGAPTWKDSAIGIRMSLELDEPLPEDCRARIWIEGDAIDVRSLRDSDNSVQMAVPIERLAEVGKADSAALEACGRITALDFGALSRIRLFASRFSETRARLLPAAPASARTASAAQ
jgi:hypothetical protein